MWLLVRLMSWLSCHLTLVASTLVSVRAPSLAGSQPPDLSDLTSRGPVSTCPRWGWGFTHSQCSGPCRSERGGALCQCLSPGAGGRTELTRAPC